MQLKDYLLSNAKVILPKVPIGIVGVGSYLPETVVKNEDFTAFEVPEGMDFPKEFGPRERRMATNESASEMAVKAAKNALENYNIDAQEIDLVISTHASKDMQQLTPPNGSFIQTAIGASNAFAFNVDCGYNGFLPSVFTAMSFIESGYIDTAMVVAGEKLLDNIDHCDFKALCIGDGAGAVILKKVNEGEGFVGFHSMSKQCEKAAGISIRSGNGNIAYDNKQIKAFLSIEPNSFQRDVPNLKKYIACSLEQTLQAVNMEAEKVDCYVFGQQFLALDKAWPENLGISYNKVHDTLEKYASMKAASIPVNLHDAVKEGRIKKGDWVALGDQGANWYISSALLRWCI
jgi:3-oxoacyl-[acyl-carrier-protein] synthase-3